MQGKLVRLRAYEKSDADALFRWFSDEEVTRWLGPPNFPSRAHQEKFIELAQSASSDDAKYFAIETLDGKLVGDCGLRFIDWKSRKAEFFITIGEKAVLGQGLRQRRAADRDSPGVRQDEPESIVANRAGRQSPRGRCYEKCGFVREGLLRQESFVDGKYRDVLLMALLREDYDRTRGA